MLRQIRTIAFYTLLEALRNRLVWLFAAIALAGIGLSGFLTELALTESRQIQLAVLAAFVRFAAVFVLATFVITSMTREFNDKGLELILALPLPRAGYLLGKLLGFAALALVPAMLFGALAACFAPPAQAAAWAVSLLGELWIVAACCLLCVLTFTHVMGALSAVMAFYLLARSVTAFQLIAHAPLASDTWSQRILGGAIDAIAMLLPRLDQFTRTEWLVYHTGSWSALGPLALQTAIYLALIVGASLFDLYRKNI
ncbi:MAG TPA: ABC transporter permease [Noviherbaspirillum sp.]|nr:ABC transporter permease [Noviherbaspirillum sp.]